MYYGVPFPNFIGVNPVDMTCRLFLVRRAAAVRAVAKMPVMVVGGFRTTAAMIESLERGELDVIGCFGRSHPRQIRRRRRCALPFDHQREGSRQGSSKEKVLLLMPRASSQSSRHRF